MYSKRSVRLLSVGITTAGSETVLNVSSLGKVYILSLGSFSLELRVEGRYLSVMGTFFLQIGTLWTSVCGACGAIPIAQAHFSLLGAGITAVDHHSLTWRGW